MRIEVHILVVLLDRRNSELATRAIATLEDGFHQAWWGLVEVDVDTREAKNWNGGRNDSMRQRHCS